MPLEREEDALGLAVQPVSTAASLFFVCGPKASPNLCTSLEETAQSLGNPDPMIEVLALSGKENGRHENLLGL